MIFILILLYKLIPILTDGVDLDIPSSARQQTILSSILLYLLITASRRYTIYKPADQAAVLTKVLSLTIRPVGGKRKGTKERSGRMKRLGALTDL